MTDLTLAARDGLPAHMRFLAERYPREMWAGHANFDGLTSFWLERHGMFRKVQSKLRTVAETYLDGASEAPRFGNEVYRLGSLFINELHGHHQIEDVHYFPMLVAREARLQAAFDLLDADHQAMDALLHGLTAETNALLTVIGQGQPGHLEADRFHQGVRDFERFLERHLADEEEIVVPIILEHGGPEVG